MGWTQEELAEQLADLGDEAIRQSDVSRIERGQIQLPRRERLERFAIALDLSMVDLLMASSWLDDEALDDEARVVRPLDKVDDSAPIESIGEASAAPFTDPVTRHRLRNRLGIVMGYVELLDEVLHEPEPDHSQARGHVQFLLNVVYGLIDDMEALLEQDGKGGDTRSQQASAGRQEAPGSV